MSSKRNTIVSAPLSAELVGVDWISLMFFGLQDLDPEQKEYQVKDCYLVDIGHGSKHFSKVAKVYVEGTEIGELKWSPRNKVIMQPGTVSFKANNEVLYSTDGWGLINQMVKQLRLKFDHCSKLDICTDGLGYMKPLTEAIKGNIRHVSKADIYTCWTKQAAEMNLSGIWVGSKKSDRFIRAYNKKRELEKSGKEYIRAWWERNGLIAKHGPDANFERLEVALKSKALSAMIPENVGKDWHKFIRWVRNQNNLGQILQTVANKMFDFRTKDPAQKNVSRWRRIFSLEYTRKKMRLLPRIRPKDKGRLKTLKMASKALYMIHKKTGLDHFHKLSAEIAFNTGIGGWWDKVQKAWSQEYERTRKRGTDYFPLFSTVKTVIVENKIGKDLAGANEYIQATLADLKLIPVELDINYARRLVGSAEQSGII